MDELWMLARRQLGLFTWAQAIQLASESTLRTLIRRRHVEPFRRGVWVVTGSPRTYEQEVLAAVLAAGQPAWASHRTAARLWELRVPSPVRIDVLTMPDRRVRLDGVDHHRNKLIVVDDVTKIGPIDVTSVARTLVDCMPWLAGRMLRDAVHDARRRKLVTLDEVDAAHAAVDEGRRTGRHLVRPMRPILAARDEPGGSNRELDVIDALRKAGVRLPVQQYPIRVAGRQRYLDYAYPAEKVYLEWDGFDEHAGNPDVFHDDRVRNDELTLMGWLGLHFTSRTRPHDLVSRVTRALAVRAA
jgi:hypothetical protein